MELLVQQAVVLPQVVAVVAVELAVVITVVLLVAVTAEVDAEALVQLDVVLFAQLAVQVNVLHVLERVMVVVLGVPVVAKIIVIADVTEDV